MKLTEPLSRFRPSREFLFRGAAILMLLIAVGYTVFAVGSLAANLRAGLAEPQRGVAPAIHFNIESLEPLIAAGKIERK